MNVLDINIENLVYAPWNSNIMDPEMLARLRESIKRYGIVQNLVVRPAGDFNYEVLSGNQRLTVLKEMGVSSTPCVIKDLDDAHARLLAQALNHIHGDDDLGLRAEVIRNILGTMSTLEVVNLLPETTNSLSAIASMGTDSVASYLTDWQQAQFVKLKRLQFRLTTSQLEVVEKALTKILPRVYETISDNPNRRGNALYLICKESLNKENENE